MNKKRFKADFEAALEVMWAFNEVIANGPAKPKQSFRRESLLPFGKGRIKNCLVYICAALEREEIRQTIQELFTDEAANLYLSSQFAATMRSHLYALAWFQSDEVVNFDDVMTRLQRKIMDSDVIIKELSAAYIAGRIRQIVGDPQTYGELLSRYGEIYSSAIADGNAYLEEAKRFDLF